MAKSVSPKELAARTGELPQVVRYLRVSRMGDRVLDSEEFHSPELQIASIDRELDRQYPGGWRLVDAEGNNGRGTWGDFDVSGTSDERVGLDASINAVAAHSASVMAVLNVSRWARGVMLGLRRIEEVQERGAELVSAEERVDYLTPSGKFALTIFLAVAEMYANEKAEGWPKLIEKRSDDGHHHGRLSVGFRQNLDPLTGKPSGVMLADESTGSGGAGHPRTPLWSTACTLRWLRSVAAEACAADRQIGTRLTLLRSLAHRCRMISPIPRFGDSRRSCSMDDTVARGRAILLRLSADPCPTLS